MKLLFTLLVILTTFSLQAQKAIDYHVTDANGVHHSLYEDYLDQGKTVVVELFFVNCGACHTMAPFLELTYRQWGQGNEDVQFMSLSVMEGDTDEEIREYEEEHKISFPAAGPEGGSLVAASQFTSGMFGPFVGAPTIIVISPNREVTWNVWSDVSWQDFMDNLNAEIEKSVLGVSNIEDGIDNISTFNVYPNPASNFTTIDFTLNTASDVRISLMNNLGQLQSIVMNERLSAGTYTQEVSLQNLASGVNWIKVESADQSQMIQLLKP